MKHMKMLATVTTLVAALLVGGAVGHAQDADIDYGDSFGYYGEEDIVDGYSYEEDEWTGAYEDEWYDPTDWFDGNNYEFDDTSPYFGGGFYDDGYYDDDWFYDYYDYDYNYWY